VYLGCLIGTWALDVFITLKEEKESREIEKQRRRYENLDQDIQEIWTWTTVKEAANY
jgi:hypothetical protein